MQRRLSPFVLASLVCLSMAMGSASTGCDDGTGATGGTGGAGATGGTGGAGATGGTAATGGTGGAGGSGGTASAGGSGGAGGAPDTACFDYSGFDGAMPVVSFKSDVLPVFQQSCGVSASCHGDPNAPNENRPYLGPNAATLATVNDIAAIMAGIVDVPSYFEPTMSIVASGDPEHSFLMHKLDHTLECSLLQCAAGKDCGGTEPQGAPDPLPESTRASIRRWIAQGAKND